MIDKRVQVLGILFFLLFMPLPGWSAKVAVLMSNSAGPYNEVLKGLRQNTPSEIQLFNMEGQLNKGRAFLSGLTPADTSCLVTLGPNALSAVESLNPNIPVVFTLVVKPVLLPKRKMSGVTMKVGIEDQFSLINKLFPDRKRIGVIYNPQNAEEDMREARKLVDRYQLSILSIAISKEDEVGDALTKFTKDTVDIIWMVVDPILLNPVVVKQLITYSLEKDIPLIGLSVFHVKAGALITFCPDYTDMGSQTAVCVQKIISETPVPVQAPRKVIVFLNPKIQKQLNVDMMMLPDIRLAE